MNKNECLTQLNIIHTKLVSAHREHPDDIKIKRAKESIHELIKDLRDQW